jgi:hypothetical protein
VKTIKNPGEYYAALPTDAQAWIDELDKIDPVHGSIDDLNRMLETAPGTEFREWLQGAIDEREQTVTA